MPQHVLRSQVHSSLVAPRLGESVADPLVDVVGFALSVRLHCHVVATILSFSLEFGDGGIGPPREQVIRIVDPGEVLVTSSLCHC